MPQFNEEFMESCVEENPRAFLGFEVTSFKRQLKLNSFRPDLLLKDSSGKVVIVEIQQRALDRYHLYKSLEYRDLVTSELSLEVSKLVLICESIEEKYLKTLSTHNIELKVFSREEFVSLAVKHCPESVEQFLLSESVATSAKTFESQKDRSRIRFNPLNWSCYDSSVQILEHLYTEFGRLGISIDRIERDYYRQIFYDLENFISTGINEAIKNLIIPSDWKIDALKEQGRNIYGTHVGDWHRIAKPRVHLFAHITQKNNFTAYWYPSEYRGGETEGDWVNWPGDGSYGWSRPANELMYIRQVTWLHPGNERSMEWDDTVNWDVLDQILVALLYTSYRDLKSALSSCLRLTVHTEFDIKTREEAAAEEWNGKSTKIIGWNLYNVEARKREEEAQWIKSFDSEYKISLSDFINLYRDVPKKKNRTGGNIERYLARDLAQKGIKLTEGRVREIIKRLREHHSHVAEQLKHN